MTKLDENMEKIFDLPATVENVGKAVEIAEESLQEIIPMDDGEAVTQANVKDDYQYARQNLKDVIETAKSSLEDLRDIASQSDSPRAYEVLSNLMKTIIESNKDLLAIQKSARELSEPSKHSNNNTPGNVNNNLFVGSTTELHKFLKENNRI